MTVVVRVPSQLRPFTKGEGEVKIDGGSNVGEVLKTLASQYPELGERIFDDSGQVRRFVNVFVADEDIRFAGGLGSLVQDGQTISVVPAVAGG